MSGEVTADPLAAGRSALRAARWQEARERLEAAPALEQSPEALEDLSWAAWWLDDGDAVFAAREAAYRLYRRRDDPAGAARMAIWLAADQLDFRGAWPVASGWLQRAHRLLDPLEARPEHGWLAFHEGYLAHAARDTGTATELAGRVTELGRRFDVPDLEMLGLALQGTTLVGCGRVAEGMRCLDEATATALGEEAAIPISGAWTFCFLVGACTSVLDFERASAWCDRIAAFADRYGSRYMLAFCRAEYGAVEIWRGRWEDAERLLEASVEDFAAARPAWVGGPLAGLAELRRRQGRAEEAERLLDRAGASTSAQLCRVRLALDEGRTQRAVELLERLLRGLPPDRALDRAPVLELVVRARVARGELDQAGTAMETLRAVQRQAGTAALAACADAGEGVLAVARGDGDRARALLEDAVDGFERCGAPFEAARARLELAACLRTLGRGEAAAREAAAALERLRALGAAPDAGRFGPLEELTAREREVLRLVAEGLTNRQIAERLVLSEHTVHRHVANLLRKLGLSSRTAAAAHAARAGLLA